MIRVKDRAVYNKIIDQYFNNSKVQNDQIKIKDKSDYVATTDAQPQNEEPEQQIREFMGIKWYIFALIGLILTVFIIQMLRLNSTEPEVEKLSLKKGYRF